MSIKAACGRCAAAPADETCWYCTGALCVDCWDRFGHCGHEAANLINEYGEIVRASAGGSLLSIGELQRLPVEDLRKFVAWARGPK